jgi:DNA repair protein RecN (Recombination protein N)
VLQSLSIRDFVIVSQLDLEFSAGFTVLTGETGAGKSILIDALSLALGARAEGGVTRVGCEKAEISASFYIAQHAQAQAWLKQSELDAEAGDLLLRRVMYADGRSRAFINGTAVTVQQLKDIGEMLVDIYSQNAHHSLLKLAAQRQILDEFGGLSLVATDLAQKFKHWHHLHELRLSLEKNAAAYADELAELRDSIRELKQLDFNAQDWAALQAEHARLSNGADLIKNGELCVDILRDGESSVLTLLAQVQHKLQTMHEYDASLGEAMESLDSGMIQLQEAGRFIAKYIQHIDLDPARLNEVEARIQAIHAAARKYRVPVEDLPQLLHTWQTRMDELAEVEDSAALVAQEAQALQEYSELAQKLSAGRQAAALKLNEKITAQMQSLSLSGGKFVVELSPQQPAASGLEQVEFLVAGHAGVTAKPLNKAASGGELSRISLAIRVVTAQQGIVPTMIFDEVDVGIGGGVAEVVGNLLKQLGVERQVLVITHLPQVAALGQHHLRVSKALVNGQTLSTIAPLDASMRIEEVARMLGGLEITETTRKHASEMLGMH